MTDTSTPVVILRSVEHGPLGILRSLGRLGISVSVIESYGWNPGFFSRYCKGRFRFDVEGSSPEALLEYLGTVRREIGRPAVLIPTSDDTAIFVARHGEQLKRWYLFPEQDAETARQLADKREMYFIARRLGVPTAETLFPQSRSEVLSFLSGVRFPLVLKGIDVMRLWRRAGRRMFIVASERELMEAYDSLPQSEQQNVMLQEHIPGGDDTVWMFNGYFDRNSECKAGFTGKKIRQCPVYSGVTSLGICLSNDVVHQTTLRFMKAVGYRGILDIGYKFDARDGRYKVLDVNPRIGATFRLFLADDGMDVARALYLDLTGQAVTAGCPREGRKWMVEDLDTVSCLRYRRDGKLGLATWLRSYRGVEETAYYAADDPMPLAAMAFIDLGKGVSRLVKRVTGSAAKGSRAARGARRKSLQLVKSQG